jgi:hypothetical protein
VRDKVSAGYALAGGVIMAKGPAGLEEKSRQLEKVLTLVLFI